MRLTYHVMSAPAPIGLLFLVLAERGLRYVEFMDRKSIRRMIQSREAENPGAVWEPSLLELKPVVDQFEAYFCGTRTEFDLPLDPVGSEFQFSVWNALRRIPYAQTRSYREIAEAVGQPKAARAVGLANGQNPLAIIVPCHRVIGADGSLVGYGGGMPRKKWLLQHEARFGRLDGQLDLRPAVVAVPPESRVPVTAKPTAGVARKKAAPARRPGASKPAATVGRRKATPPRKSGASKRAAGVGRKKPTPARRPGSASAARGKRASSAARRAAAAKARGGRRRTAR